MEFQVRGSGQINGFLSVQKSSKLRTALNLFSFSTLFTCTAFIMHSVFPSSFPISWDRALTMRLQVVVSVVYVLCISRTRSSFMMAVQPVCLVLARFSLIYPAVFKFRMSSRQWALQCLFLLRFLIITPTDFSSLFYQLHTRKGKVMARSQYHIAIVSPKSRA